MNQQISKADTFFNEILDRTNLALRRRGFVDITPRHFLERTSIPFIYKLIAEVEDAFVCSPVLKAFGSLDIRNLPDSIQEAITTDYGLGDIHSLAEFYGNPKTDEFQGRLQHCESDIPADIIRAEYLSFRTQLYILN